MLLKKKISVFFLFPQNDQSTEDLHIVGAEDLSFLAGKVIFLSSTTASSPTFNKEQHMCPAERHSKLSCNKTNSRVTWEMVGIDRWPPQEGSLPCNLPSPPPF